MRQIARRAMISAMVFAWGIGVTSASAGFRNPAVTASGQVSGVPGTNASVTVFKGIPYAAPPVGKRRWREPAPPQPWTGVRSGATFGPHCIQPIVDSRPPWTSEYMAHGAVSEDCLTLNVWTPAQQPGTGLPVFVYIYGGAFNEGSGAIATYDGEGLASRGLVVITFNYRLGALGFLAHPELTAESAHHASGNYGLLDQIAALQWVKRNIAAFGGDPSRVTIAGQSAGAMSVHALVASPLAKGLFHRAIAQSGSTAARPGATGTRLPAGEQAGLAFAKAAGAASIADLRAMPAEALLKVPASAERPGLRFGPVVDGYVLPAPTAEIIAKGLQNDVPTLTGCNADEGGASPAPAATLEAYTKAAARHGEFAARFLALYPATSDADAGAMQNAAARDQARTSMYLWAMQRAATARTAVFTYYWNHPLPGPDQAKYGAFHSGELPYTFDALRMSDRPFTATDRALATQMADYWANFAKRGDPNGPGLPRWPAVRPDAAETMQLGDGDGPIPVAGSAEKLAFWREAIMRPAPMPVK